MSAYTAGFMASGTRLEYGNWFDHRAKMVVVSHTVCAHVGTPRDLGDDGRHALGQGVADSYEHARVPRAFTIPKFVARFPIVKVAL